MPRLNVLLTLCLAAGIALAHVVFYNYDVKVPAWLDVALLLLAAVLTAGLYLAYRRSLKASVFAHQHVFLALLFALVALFGFARYAAEARRVQVEWSLMAHPPTNRGNPDEMDYRLYRWTQGTAPDSTSLSFRLQAAALRLRSVLLERYASTGLTDEAYALVAAMTLGERSHLTPSTRDLYAEAGASHLLALSGMHLSFVVGVLITLLTGRLRNSPWRIPTGVLTLSLVWTYCALAAFPPSLVRAGLMVSVAVMAVMVRRYTAAIDALVFTAATMLWLRPFTLLDVGAQLSFASMTGILVLHHRIMSYASRRYRPVVAWLTRHHLWMPVALLSVSLCAQVFTLPLVAFHFHRIAPYATLFSLVYVPLTTLIIYAALLLLLLAWILPPLATVVASALSAIIALQVGVMRWEVSLPGAVVNDFWSPRARRELVVYNNRHCPALHLINTPAESYLLLPRPDSVDVGLRRISESFWRRRLTAEPKSLSGSVIEFESHVVVMLDRPVGSTAAMQLPRRVPKEVDMLWLTSDYDGTLTTVSAFFHPRWVVLDASLKPWVRRRAVEECRLMGWRWHDIREQGALRLSID